MNVSRFGLAILGSLLLMSSAQAHPGHEIDGGLLASIEHSLMSTGYLLFLLAPGVVYGLWVVSRRVSRKSEAVRVRR